MPSILLVNPIKGHKRKTKMAHKSLRGRRRNAKGQLMPETRHKSVRRRRRNPLVMDLGGHKGLRKHKAKRNPIRHARRRPLRRYARRNPIGRALSGQGFWGQAMTGMIAIPVAAIAADLVYGYIPIPSSMTSGLMKPIGKLAIAMLVAVGAKHFLPRGVAVMVAAGAVGGVLYDSSKSYMQTAFPTLPLSGLAAMAFSDMNPGMGLPAPAANPSYLGADPSYLGDEAMGAYMDNSMAGYLTNE